MTPTKIRLIQNPNYGKSGTKSYVHLMRKYHFSPTKEGPYFIGGMLEQMGRPYMDKAVGGRARIQKVLQKKAIDSDRVGEVGASDVQDDLMYLAEVSVGTPAQTVHLDFDTGSADLWVWSTKLSHSLWSWQSEHNIFDPSKSSTFQNQVGSTWKIEYADKSFASGSVGTDNVNIGGLVVKNQAIELAYDMSTQFARGAGDGLLGLGFSAINTVRPQPVNTPVENMVMQDDIPLSSELFTAKLGSWRDADESDEGASFYTFGFIDQATVQATGEQIYYTPVDNSLGVWMFESVSATVNGQPISRVGNKAIADTGATLALVDDSTCQAIYDAIPGAFYDSENQGYIYPTNTTIDQLPIVSFAVGGKQFVVQKEDLGFAEARPGYVYGGIQSRGKMDHDILGGTFLKAIYAVFDVGNLRFGAVQRKELHQNLSPGLNSSVSSHKFLPLEGSIPCSMDPITMEIQPEDLEIDLPTVEELEHFARLGQLGRFSDAKSYFRENLKMYTDVFPVIAENASLLLDQNLYGDLREFLLKLLKQEELQQNLPETSAEKLQQTADLEEIGHLNDILGSFNSNEMHLMQLFHSFCTLHTEGSMGQALKTMRNIKEQSSTGINPISPQGEQDSTSQNLREVPKLEDTEIQIILTRLRIAMFAATQSNWVYLTDFQLPWTRGLDPQAIWLDIENWCLNLAAEGRKEAADLLKVLLQGYLSPEYLPREPEAAKKHAMQAANYGRGEQDVGTQHSSLFEKFIETVGDCQFSEGKLLLRFAAREAYCSLLRGRSQIEMAAELLDPMKSDIDFLSQWDPEMKLSRQYLQWGFLQYTLVGQYNGFNTTPRLEELLPVAERLADYPMQQKIFEELGKENRMQIMVHDFKFAETSFFRYMKISEMILEKRIQSVLELARLLYDENCVVKNMCGKEQPEAVEAFRQRCISALEQLQGNHPELDVPLIRHNIRKALKLNVEDMENDVPLYVREQDLLLRRDEH